MKHILKSKRIAHREDEDLENFEERKMERKKVINEAMKENARLLSIGWENYVKNAIKKEGDWSILYNRTQLSEYYKWDSLPLCPYCGLETCGTLDHFLPKSEYLLLSTTPFNLIPCCFICNNKKVILIQRKNISIIRILMKLVLIGCLLMGLNWIILLCGLRTRLMNLLIVRKR